MDLVPNSITFTFFKSTVEEAETMLSTYIRKGLQKAKNATITFTVYRTANAGHCAILFHDSERQEYTLQDIQDMGLRFHKTCVFHGGQPLLSVVK